MARGPNRTSAQKKRNRDRMKSIDKQASAGRGSFNTSRFDTWGLPQGATPPAEDTNPCGTGVTVDKKYADAIIESMGDTPTKAYGYTAKQFPMYAIEKMDSGEWRVRALTFKFQESRSVSLVALPARIAIQGVDESVPVKGPAVAKTSRKKDAMELIGAGNSWKYEARWGTYYIVPSGSLTGGAKSFSVSSEERDRVHEGFRSGQMRRVDSDSKHGDSVPMSELR